MNTFKRKLIFWRCMAIITVLGGVIYAAKYDVDFIFILFLLVFAMMLSIIDKLKEIINR